MEDFFDKIRKPGSSAEEDYIRSEATRLRAYLYTLREEDRQREIERLQEDLTYWDFVFCSKDNWNNHNLLEYALYCLNALKREQRIGDSEEYKKFLDQTEEAKYLYGVEGLPDKDKVSGICYILEGKRLSWGIYRDFRDVDLSAFPSAQHNELTEEGIKEKPKEIPPELDKAEVREYLQEAKNIGLIGSNYKWMGGKAELALFCACMSYVCEIYDKKDIPNPDNPKKPKKAYLWKPYELLFYGKALPPGKGLGNNFRTLQNSSNKRLEGKTYQGILKFFKIKSIDDVLR